MFAHCSRVLGAVALCCWAVAALAQSAAEPAVPNLAPVDAEVGLLYPMPDEPVVGLVDIDLDGYVDVITGGRVWRNNGHNHFEQPVVPRGTFFSFGDFDNDGKLDVFATSYYKERIPIPTEEKEKPSKDTGKGKKGEKTRKEEEKPKEVEKTKAEHFLLHNDGDGKYTDVLSKSGLTAPAVPRKPSQPGDEYELEEKILDVSRAHGFLDYDNDGNLDLFVAGFEIAYTADSRRALTSRLFKGDGAGHFKDVSEAAGIKGVARPATDVAFCDFDNDGFIDIYVTNDRSQPNCLWHNQGDGTFRDIAEDVEASCGNASSRAVVVGDFDNDGDFDIFIVNYSHDNPGKPQPRSMLLRNDLIPDGRLHFTDVTAEVGLAWQPPEGYKAEATWLSGVWADLNNDSWLDLLVTETCEGGKNHPNAPLKNGRFDSGYSKCWLSRAGQSFVRVDTERNKLRIEDTAGVAAADFDNDGWCDLLVGSNPGQKSERITWFDPSRERTMLLRGRGLGGKSGAENAGYLNIILKARDRALNGALVEVTLDNQQTLRAVLDTSGGGLRIKSNQLRFGLGAHTASRIGVTLPGGDSVGFEGPWRDAALLLDLSKKAPSEPQTLAPWKQ